MSETSRMSGKFVAMIIVVIAVAALVFYSTMVNHTDEAPSTREAETISVVGIAAAPHRFQEEIRAVGTLTAQSRALVSPKVAGNVQHTAVELGDVVASGEELFRIDPTNYQLALQNAQAAVRVSEAAVAQARVQADRAQKEYTRARDLLKSKVVPQSGYDTAEAAYLAAKETVNLAVQQHKQAQVALEVASTYLADTRVQAPISGVVVARKVEIGQSVAPGIPLITIVDQAKLWVEVDLAESNYSDITTETPVNITIDALPGKAVQGEISTINPLVDRKTRAFTVHIDIDNPDGELVDGMFARVVLLTQQREALAVPRDALIKLPGSGTHYVFVANNGVAKKTNVVTGLSDDDYVEIKSGIEEGDIVVTTGTSRLRSGTPVTLKGDG